MAKHLSLEDRNLIAQRLNEGCSFKAIAKELERNPTSISREVRNHLIFKQAEASMPVSTDLPAINFIFAANVPTKDSLLFVRIVSSAIMYAVISKRKSVRNFLLRLMSATAVLNATLPVLWKNDFTSPWMHGKNIRKSFPKHAVASHFPKKRFPIWMK